MTWSSVSICPRGARFCRCNRRGDYPPHARPGEQKIMKSNRLARTSALGLAIACTRLRGLPLRSRPNPSRRCPAPGRWSGRRKTCRADDGRAHRFVERKNRRIDRDAASTGNKISVRPRRTGSPSNRTASVSARSSGRSIRGPPAARSSSATTPIRRVAATAACEV